MRELIARAMQGVDPADPAAFVHIFMNLMALVPWGWMIFWQVVFVAVGGLLGGWKGRVRAGVIASLVLGPVGWIVPFLPARRPPPLPPARPRPDGALPPPLPRSKKR